jgi:hypothetical protein
VRRFNFGVIAIVWFEKMRLCLWITPISEELRVRALEPLNSSESRTSSSTLTTIAMVFGMSQLH